MTRKEAEAEAKELNAVDPKWFCPLINALCRKDCVNFMPAFVESDERDKNGKRKSVSLHTVDDEDFYVDGFSCTNAMFIQNPIFGCGSD